MFALSAGGTSETAAANSDQRLLGVWTVKSTLRLALPDSLTLVAVAVRSESGKRCLCPSIEVFSKAFLRCFKSTAIVNASRE